MGLRVCGPRYVSCSCLLFCALARSVQMWEAVKASACSAVRVCSKRPAVPVGCKRHLCSYSRLSSAWRRCGCQLMSLVSRSIRLCRPGLPLRSSLCAFVAHALVQFSSPVLSYWRRLASTVCLHFPTTVRCDRGCLSGRCAVCAQHLRPPLIMETRTCLLAAVGRHASAFLSYPVLLYSYASRCVGTWRIVLKGHRPHLFGACMGVAEAPRSVRCRACVCSAAAGFAFRGGRTGPPARAPHCCLIFCTLCAARSPLTVLVRALLSTCACVLILRRVASAGPHHSLCVGTWLVVLPFAPPLAVASHSVRYRACASGRDVSLRCAVVAPLFARRALRHCASEAFLFAAPLWHPCLRHARSSSVLWAAV